MIGVVIAAFASILAASGLLVVARHSQTLLEIGVRAILTIALLLLPAAPFVLLIGVGRIGVIPSVILAIGCCAPSFFVARKTMQILERQGTDRVKDAMDAMSRLMGAAILMLSYVAIVGALAAATQFGVVSAFGS